MKSIRWFVLALLIGVVSAAAVAQLNVVIRIGPPALPVYEQPPCPAEGYIWTPGYWAYDYDYDDYYWVPGTWVEAPQVGYLWTPAYWAWGGDRFIFHEGYWGPQVGFYGGIVYGFGYFGHGYEGGRWDNGRFFYNRSVNNVNVTNIHNVYNTTINNVTINRVSYNGGNGGINDRPRPEEEAAERERHVPPVAAQTRHIQDARNDRQLRASVNQGRPPVAATPKPGDFKDRQAVAAKEAGAPYHPASNREANQPRNEANQPRNEGNQPRNEGNQPRNDVPRPPDSGNGNARPGHAKDLTPRPRPPAPNTGNEKQNQKYQQQEERLSTRQEQERQKLAQKQDQDHQKMERSANQAKQQQNAAKQQQSEARQQQMEQKHQQQTQKLEQKHEQQSQKIEKREAPRKPTGQQPEPEKH